MFVLYLDGGDGCDHTLACNKLLHLMKAQTWDEAREEAKDHLGDPMADPRRGYGCGEGIMKSAVIMEVGRSEDVDINAWAMMERQKNAAAAADDARAKERAEFERLKAKFA